MAQNISSNLAPCYGIGYTRARQLGPAYYAIGLNYGSGISAKETVEQREEALAVSRWSDMGMADQVYRKGLIRDVYEWNFLTAPQLEMPVQSQTLEAWIRANPARGKLSDLTPTMKLWEVRDKRDRKAARQVLWDAGVIFNWRAYHEAGKDAMDKAKREFLAALQAGQDYAAMLALVRAQQATGLTRVQTCNYIAEISCDEGQTLTRDQLGKVAYVQHCVIEDKDLPA